jgi:hypothetical protein
MDAVLARTSAKNKTKAIELAIKDYLERANIKSFVSPLKRGSHTLAEVLIGKYRIEYSFHTH